MLEFRSIIAAPLLIGKQLIAWVVDCSIKSCSCIIVPTILGIILALRLKHVRMYTQLHDLLYKLWTLESCVKAGTLVFAEELQIVLLPRHCITGQVINSISFSDLPTTSIPLVQLSQIKCNNNNVLLCSYIKYLSVASNAHSTSSSLAMIWKHRM